MDFATLFAMINGQQSGGMPPVEGGIQYKPQTVTLPPLVAPVDASTKLPAPTPMATTPARKQGFSTGNILNALFGSNFGQQ